MIDRSGGLAIPNALHCLRSPGITCMGFLNFRVVMHQLKLHYDYCAFEILQTASQSSGGSLRWHHVGAGKAPRLFIGDQRIFRHTNYLWIKLDFWVTESLETTTRSRFLWQSSDSQAMPLVHVIWFGKFLCLRIFRRWDFFQPPKRKGLLSKESSRRAYNWCAQASPYKYA